MSIVKSIGSDKWLVFVVSIPTSNTTLRMRIWRALKALGCAVLRDGVYLLPAGRGLRQSLRVHAEEIKNGGGNGYLLNVSTNSTEEKQQFQSLFDRSNEYREQADKISAFRDAYPTLEAAAARRQLKLLRRDLESITRTDYFPNPLRFDVEDLLAEVETAFLSSQTPRAGDASEENIAAREHQDFQARIWATRKRPGTDHLASAWLIQRFIDPDAHFKWLTEGATCPAHAVSFGFDGAEFRPICNLATFEILLASFGLEGDAGLVRIGTIVHCLATGTLEVAEATGVERILKGVLRSYKDHDTLLAETSRLFDLLYAGYTGGGK